MLVRYTTLDFGSFLSARRRALHAAFLESAQLLDHQSTPQHCESASLSSGEDGAS